MTEPLDVSLRVRMRYEAGGTARQAVADMEQLRAKAEQLGHGSGATVLARDLGRVSAPAEAARRNVLDLGAAVTRLGAGGLAKAVAAEIAAVGKATQPVKRDFIDLNNFAHRFGTARLGKGVSDEMRAISASIRVGARDVLQLGSAVEKLGATGGAYKLERELDGVARKADDARRRVDRLRETTGGGGRRGIFGGVGSFGDDAMSGAGVAGALRYGAIGFAVGRGVQAAGRAMANAAEQAIQFETSMAEVAKAADEMSPQEFARLRNTIQTLSRRTGVSQGEIATSVAQAGYAGRPTGDLPAFAELASKTAPAWGVSSEQAGDFLAKFGNVFHFDQAGIKDAANTVDYLGNRTAAKERDIAYFQMRSGSTTQLAGMNFGQSAALGATMLSQGMQPEVAATAANAILEKLSTRNDKDKDYQQGLRDLHMNSRGLMADMKRDPGQGLVKFFEALSKAKNPLETAVRLFGREHADEASATANAYQQLATNLGLANDQQARSSSIDQSFTIYSATTRASIDKMTASVASLATKLGRELNPAIKFFADTIAHIAGGWAKDIDLSEQAEVLTQKVIRHQQLTPEEVEQLAKNPKLKSWVTRRSGGRAAETPEGRAALGQGWNGFDLNMPEQFGPEAPPKPVDNRSWFGRLFHRSRADAGDDLAGTARVSLAAYNAELQAGMDRATRIVDTAAKRINEDLTIKARFAVDGSDGLGESGGIIKASFGDGSIGGGSAGGSVSFGSRSFGRGGGRFNGLGVNAGSDRPSGAALGRPGRARRGSSGGDDAIPDTGYEFRGNQIAGLSDEATRQYAEILGKRESGNRYGIVNPYGYAGRWQMGAGALQETGYVRRGKVSNGMLRDPSVWTGKGEVHSLDEFLANKGGVQDRELAEYTNRHFAQLKRAGVIKDGMGQDNTAGWLAAAHLKGVGGAERLNRGQDNSDANGTTASSYRRMMARVGAGSVPPARASASAGMYRDYEVQSPRFAEPDRMQLDRGGTAGGRASGGSAPAPASTPPMTSVQNFYGGFDEQQVARRAQLEKNREIRRAQARALHDVGRVA